MKIFLFGDARCGKSSAARFLAQSLGCEMAETGQVVINELAKMYAAGNGSVDGMQTWSKLINAGKCEFRKELSVIGDLMTRISPTYLIDECGKRARIVVGVRRRREVLGYFQSCGRQSWNSIWIRVVARQPHSSDSSYELHGQPCDYEVQNTGDLNELQQKMYALARVIASKSVA